MAKATLEIRSLARGHTATAINVLAGIMQQKSAPAAARVAAAKELLDRGWGKAPQDMNLSGTVGLVDVPASDADRAKALALFIERLKKGE